MLARLVHPYATPNQEFRGVFLLGTFGHRSTATRLCLFTRQGWSLQRFLLISTFLHDIMRRTSFALLGLCYSQPMTAQYVTNSNSIWVSGFMTTPNNYGEQLGV